MKDVDVIVIGAGPVGQAALGLLGSCGVSAICMDRAPDIWPNPRAVHFDGETLRTFQTLGLGQDVLDITAPMTSYCMTNEEGETLMAFPSGATGSEGWPDDVMFHQPQVDELVREALKTYGSVRLEAGLEAVAISQSAHEVVVTTVDSDGIEGQLRASYVIGADGASSFVRHALGIRYEQLGPNNPWLVVDGVYTEDPPELASMHLFGKHSRPALWATLPGKRRRMEFKVLPGDDETELATAEWLAEASRGLMRPDNFVIDRTAVYTFRSALANTWRVGRIFLAGDAAHLAPPLFGQGLCSGIRDAANLTWKLALVLRGADASLLDTYESERQPHARAWVEQATTMSEMIQATTQEVAAQRDAFIRAHPTEGAPRIPPLGVGFHNGEAGGLRAPQPALARPADFDEQLGYRFLIAGTAAALRELPNSARDTLNDSPIVLVLDDSSPGVDELLKSVEADAIIVRPDRYIYGTALTGGELEPLLGPILAICRDVTDPIVV